MPVATGALRVVSEGDYAGANFERADGYRLTLETLPESYASFGILHYKDKSGKLINSIYIPKKSGNMMLDSDGYVPKGWSNYHGFMKCGRMEARVGKGAQMLISPMISLSVLLLELQHLKIMGLALLFMIMVLS